MSGYSTAVLSPESLKYNVSNAYALHAVEMAFVL